MIPTVTGSNARMIGPPAADGSSWIRYELTTSDGNVITIEGMGEPAGVDTAARLAELKIQIEAQLAAVPPSVNLSQARQAVLKAGLKARVEAAIAQADQATQELWYSAKEVERNHPSVIALGAALGLTPAQIDDLFRRAASL